MQAAVLLDIIAALRIAASRAATERLKSGITSAQNLPLALVILVVILLGEFSSRKIGSTGKFLLAASATLFLVCSFYLPPTGQYSSEVPSVLAYMILILQLSITVVAFGWRRLRPDRVLATFLFFFAVLTIAGFLYTFSLERISPVVSRQDAAVVLGASVWGKHRPSPLLQGRLDEAMKIFKSGLTKKMVTTGGTVRFGTVESEVQAWYLQENGIPDSSLIMERETFCTSEQAVFIKSVLMDSLGMKKIVVVSDRWHLPRALLMCRFEDADVTGAASNYRLPVLSELYFRVRESAALQAYLLFGA